MSKVWLITGAAGFIGSNLASRLLAAGQDVIGLDNLSAGLQSNVDRVMAGSDGRYRFVQGDICDDATVATCFEEKIDVVVHFAAQGSVQRSFDEVAYNNRQNIDGFLNMLQASGEHVVPQFIYASSCAIYGDTEVLPITEALCPEPVSPYASSKLMNDLLAQNLAHLYPETRLSGLRFFNIFGPWQDPRGAYAAVVPRWIDLCLSGSRPAVFGDGGATRDFCYVGNVCDLIESLGTGEAGDGGVSGMVYNVASEVPTSLNDLYMAVTESLRGRGVDIPFDGPEYKPWREGDIVHSLGSINRARAQLGFEPQVDLRGGIERILTEQYKL